MKIRIFVPVGICLLLLTACSLDSLLTGSTPTPTAIPTITPSPTPILAAVVNGEGIPLTDLDREVQRFEKAQSDLGIDLATLVDYRRQVLQAMAEERAAAQASAASGAQVNETQVDTAIQSVIQSRGGNEAFQTWLTDNLYTLEEYRTALRRQLLINIATDNIASQVPLAAEQVHARHILIASPDLAATLLSSLAGGSDFAAAARTYSLDLNTRLNSGDLGWFARGTLTIPEVEDAAFSLQPGQMSQVVPSKAGYHIVQTLERADSRPLSPALLENLRRRAVETWLINIVQKSQIQFFLP